MANINGYFKLFRDEKGTSIRIFPPGEGGEPVSYDEVINYLTENKFENVDVASINRAVEEGKTAIKEAIVTLTPGYPVNERMIVRYEEDNMVAVARFYPASNDGKDIDKDEIMSDISFAGIKYGIKEEAVDSFLNERQYCKDYIIAEGKRVRQGKGASIEYFFNTDRKIRPKKNEDGSVDFHQLDNISHVKKGDVLARLTPADLGAPGTTVFGAQAAPYKVEQLVLKFGKNITLSEDKLTIVSDVDGHAVLEQDKVFVSNTYEVPADVDNSTGDISYEGNVVVRGNVRTNFKIQASGDVEVYGTVEGATIVSGGQIILHRGIQGMSKGMMVAKGNIVAKFIESARVYTDGFIETEAIIQSQVAAKGEINVNGVKGNIIGGHVRSTSLVAAKTIGSNMGISTTIEVGNDPATQDKMNKLKDSINEKNEQLRRLTQLVDMMQAKLKQGKLEKDKVPVLKKSLEDMNTLQEEVKAAQFEISDLMDEMQDNALTEIRVRQDIFHGVKLIIGGEIKLVNEALCRCKFKKERGEIKSMAL